MDPLNVTTELEGLVLEPNTEITDDDFTETLRFFKKFRKQLVHVFPMQTSHKCRYASGTHIKHLRAREAPEAKDFWVANTARLTNIASGQLLEGDYTPEEEIELMQYEKYSMLHPATNQAQQQSEAITDFVRRGMYIYRPPPTPSESSDEFDFDMDDYEYDWDREVDSLGHMANAVRPQVSLFCFF